jgi:hypothetical protein
MYNQVLRNHQAAMLALALPPRQLANLLTCWLANPLNR